MSTTSCLAVKKPINLNNKREILWRKYWFNFVKKGVICSKLKNSDTYFSKKIVRKNIYFSFTLNVL